MIVESYQWVNNFSTLSEQNLSQFIDIAEEVLQNDQRSCPNFGITDNQQKNKNLILIHMNTKQLRAFRTAVSRLQSTIQIIGSTENYKQSNFT